MYNILPAYYTLDWAYLRLAVGGGKGGRGYLALQYESLGFYYALHMLYSDSPINLPQHPRLPSPLFSCNGHSAGLQSSVDYEALGSIPILVSLFAKKLQASNAGNRNPSI